MSDLIPLPEDLDHLEFTRVLAARALPDALNKLVLRLQDDRVTTPNLQSGIDQLGKISGLYAKQEQKSAGPGFSINIILDGGTPQAKTITIGGNEGIFDQIPSYMSGSSGNLAQVEVFSE